MAGNHPRGAVAHFESAPIFGIAGMDSSASGTDFQTSRKHRSFHWPDEKPEPSLDRLPCHRSIRAFGPASIGGIGKYLSFPELPDTLAGTGPGTNRPPG